MPGAGRRDDRGRDDKSQQKNDQIRKNPGQTGGGKAPPKNTPGIPPDKTP